MSEQPEFPSPIAILVAYKLMGFDPKAPDSPPCCDACGAPIETGLLAMFCPFAERCALRPAEGLGPFEPAADFDDQDDWDICPHGCGYDVTCAVCDDPMQARPI